MGLLQSSPSPCTADIHPLLQSAGAEPLLLLIDAVSLLEVSRMAPVPGQSGGYCALPNCTKVHDYRSDGILQVKPTDSEWQYLKLRYKGEAMDHHEGISAPLCLDCGYRRSAMALRVLKMRDKDPDRAMASSQPSVVSVPNPPASRWGRRFSLQSYDGN